MDRITFIVQHNLEIGICLSTQKMKSIQGCCWINGRGISNHMDVTVVASSVFC